VAKLKVFRTAIGFHDAYVAAPSRAAALRAWGADKDLFARGSAEEVTDSALMAEPLERPGDVIRRSRGTAAEQLAALPPKLIKHLVSADGECEAAPARTPTPDRSELDAAEAALSVAEARIQRVLDEITEREEALARERRKAERDGRDEMRRLERVRDRAAAAYGRVVAAQEGAR
jgi:hypothetical protein